MQISRSEKESFRAFIVGSDVASGIVVSSLFTGYFIIRIIIKNTRTNNHRLGGLNVLNFFLNWQMTKLSPWTRIFFRLVMGAVITISS